MKFPLRMPLAFCLLLASANASGQMISGSTNLSIDPTTNIVTATCETDGDEYVIGYYEVEANCVIRDALGNLQASGQYIDDQDAGSAVVVLQIQGEPGQTYIATGRHVAIPVIPQDNPDGGGGGTGNRMNWLDEYNFWAIAYPESGSAPFPLAEAWFGSGPETNTPTHALSIGATTDRRVAYYTQGELTNIISNAQALLSPNCDRKFAAVIPSYSNAGFFASLQATTFRQFPFGTPTPPQYVSFGSDATTSISEPGRPINLLPNFYPPSGITFPPGHQEFILIHEGIHHFTGWRDNGNQNGTSPTFPDQFGVVGYPSTGAQTSDFTDWITQGCPP